jgi:hypothetical protein
MNDESEDSLVLKQGRRNNLDGPNESVYSP